MSEAKTDLLRFMAGVTKAGSSGAEDEGSELDALTEDRDLE